MTLKKLMETLAEKLELTDVALTEDGSAQILFDGVHEVEIHAHDERPGFGLSASVGPMPEDDEERAEACLYLLEGNLLGDATNGAALSLDPERGEIVLCRSINQVEISYEAFEAELAGFLAALRAWKGEDAAGETGVGAAADTTELPDGAAAQAAMVRV